MDKWSSKQRDYDPTRPRVRDLTKGVMVPQDEDDIVDAELLSWIYTSPKRKKGQQAALSELIEFCRTEYKCPPAPPYHKSNVIRRTLSLKESCELDYFTGSNVYKDSKDVRKHRNRDLTRGHFTPDTTPYREIGDTYGQPAHLDGKELLARQLSDGLSKEAKEQIKEIGKKKPSSGIMGAESTSAVTAFMQKLRVMGRRSCRDVKDVSNVSMRHTNSILQEGTKRMYEMLHETEHRLLAIQAGGSYLSHVSACRERRHVVERMKAYKEEGMGKTMRARPITASEDAGVVETETTTHKLNKKGIMIAVSRAIKLTIRDIVHNNNFPRASILARKRQFYYDKLMAIYTILCTILNMKNQRFSQGVIPWSILKKLRADPYEDTTSPFVQLRRASSVKAHTNRRGGVATLPMKKKSSAPPAPVMPKTRRLTFQTEKKDSLKKLPPLNTKCSKASSTRAQPDATRNKVSMMTAVAAVGANGTPSQRTSMASTAIISAGQKTRGNLGTVGNRTSRIGVSMNLSNHQKVREASVLSQKPPIANTLPVTEVIPNDMFDPAAITWDEFVKWGSTRDKKARFVQIREQMKSVKANPSASGGSLAREPAYTGFTGSTNAMRKSISHMWQVMRRSFMEQMKPSSELSLGQKDSKAKNLSLMKQLGLDNANPISHLKLNWMKIKLRSNKMMIKEIAQRQKESENRYRAMAKSKDLSDTRQWKHKWSQQFQAKRRLKLQERAEQYLECVEELLDEAQELQLHGNVLVRQIINKIRLVCSTDRIKYMTIYRGQEKISCIVMSTPAFELCTLQVQSALQFVLVDVLNGETELLFPMFKQRGLPMHPGVLDNQLDKSLSMSKPLKMNINNYVAANKLLSSVPPDRPGMSRNIIKRLEKNVVYNAL